MPFTPPTTIDQLTDEAIDNAGTQLLRNMCMTFELPDYIVRVEVASFTLTDSVVAHGDSLTFIDRALGCLKSAYERDGLEPKRVKRYSDQLMLTVWRDDDSLRYHLKYHAEKARKVIEDKAQEELLDMESENFPQSTE